MEVHNNIRYRKEVFDIKAVDYLKSKLPKGYIVEQCGDELRIEKKGLILWWMQAKIKYRNGKPSHVIVYDKNLWDVLYEFGQNFKFEHITQEWKE